MHGSQTLHSPDHERAVSGDQPKKSTGIPLGVWSGSDATERLRETLREVDRSSRRQGTIMIWLTGMLVVMTGVRSD